MTSSVENDPDALKICPYDPVHKVKAKRPFGEMSKAICKCLFFAQHEIRVEELEYHISTCEYKDMIRQDTEEGGDKMFYARSISVFWVLFLACTVLCYPRNAQVGCVRPIGSYWTRLEFPCNETTRENFIC